MPGPTGRGINPNPGGNDRGSQHLRPQYQGHRTPGRVREREGSKFAQLGDNVKDIDVKFSKDGHLGGESIRVEITVVGTGPVLRSEAQGNDKFAVFGETQRQAPGASAPYATAASWLARWQAPGICGDATGSIPVVSEAITGFCCRIFRWKSRLRQREVTPGRRSRISHRDSSRASRASA